MKNKFIYFSILICILFLSLVIAESVSELSIERQNRLVFGHVIVIENVNTSPQNIIPGKVGNLNLQITNTGSTTASDVRLQINLPDELLFFEDISKRKIAKLYAGESQKLSYNIIALPTASEGIYESSITIDYISHIGSERQDNDTFGIIIKSEPKLFSFIESSEIYKGNDIGSITIKFVNNGIADIKFLTVELQDSEEYKILEDNKEYIGDLDSDDFESVSFRVKVDEKKDKIVFPLKISYKDSLNNNYEEQFGVNLEILKAKEAGIDTNGTIIIVLVVFLAAGAGYYYYKKYKKKKAREAKFK